MSDFRYKLSFRVTHPSRDLSHVVDALKWAPFRIWKVGDRRTDMKGRPLEGTYDKSYCTFRLDREPAPDLSVLMEETVAYLSRHKGMLDELIATGGKFNFFVGWFSGANSGELFDWKLLQQLADLNISLDMDVYADTGEDLR